MAKLKAPLLGLGAHGTVGEAITYQSRKQLDIVREKPTPQDPYTLRQFYQRSDYRRYLALWNTLSAADKRVWAQAGSRAHNTAVGAFMRHYLKGLPDLAFRYHLDELGGIIAYDSSRNSINGTIIGAIHSPGYFNGALSFDGINDSVFIPHHARLVITQQITILAWVYPTLSVSCSPVFAAGAIAPVRGLYLGCFGPGTQFLVYLLGIGWSTSGMGADPPLNRWSRLAATYDGTNISYSLGGILQASAVIPGTIEPDVEGWRIGGGGPVYGLWLRGRIDEPEVLDRALTQAELLIDAERSHPG